MRFAGNRDALAATQLEGCFFALAIDKNIALVEEHLNTRTADGLTLRAEELGKELVQALPGRLNGHLKVAMRGVSRVIHGRPQWA